MRRFHPLAAAGLLSLLAVFGPLPAGATMVNCSQMNADRGMTVVDYLHFDRRETCFGDRNARFTGYALLIQNTGEIPCKTALTGGVFAYKKWLWSAPTAVRFAPLETKEVAYDFTGVSEIPVGDIQALYTSANMYSACGGSLQVRYTEGDNALAAGTYFNNPGKEAYFKIFSEDFTRASNSRNAVGHTYVRLPKMGVVPRRAPLPYEDYSDIRASIFPVARDAKRVPLAADRILNQYQLDYWDDSTFDWTTLLTSGPKDVSLSTVSCGDGSQDCYGDSGTLKQSLDDGRYRIRARISWGKKGWLEWSPWQEFTVNFWRKRLPTANVVPDFKERATLWFWNSLLGTDPLW